MIYYQVQYRNTDGSWEAYGEAYTKMIEATEAFGEFLSGYYSDRALAVRIVSVWQRWDKVWTVKEVLEYRDLDTTV